MQVLFSQKEVIDIERKTIIHQRIPINNGHMEFSMDQVYKLHKGLRDSLPNDYIVLTTPTDLSVLDGNAKIIQIDAKKYSTNELLEIIEKAAQYDDLCK